ncbi:riboflavin synthase subunit alpha [Burkholderia contaminans]|uniref:riboflavin synthase subunit alpha n=1 Tax=Burkholderia contaminans TaxID=488447 RepID=UPI001CF182A1|nr:riboflavin synthase subunit alpha [Burkholderia contaminans]MCA7916725.1 riboflavin synthase subunit alpha [Burkholderia contaminans]MCA8096051.1 riboflavin synthase subunit alpha [Burkholderia contaminans]UUX39913.1 riboflavin synthase subunit alpha [Burkholderia contaminans]
MFTGIVQGVGVIKAIKDHGELRTFSIEFPEHFTDDIEIGASVSVDGVCLTVTTIHSPELIDFDVMLPSLRITTLADLTTGARINVERAAKDGAEIGGHPLSGHVDFTGTIRHIAMSEHNRMVRIGVPEAFKRYVFAKGYIAINGCSLTVSDVNRDEGWFDVWLIPETRRATTFDAKGVNDTVNIEIERSTQVVVDTIREAVKETLGELNGVVTALLAEKGIDIEELLARRVARLPKQ